MRLLLFNAETAHSRFFAAADKKSAIKFNNGTRQGCRSAGKWAEGIRKAADRRGETRISFLSSAARQGHIKATQKRGYPYMPQSGGYKKSRMQLTSACGITFILKNLLIAFAPKVVPRGGIEPPTQGFSVPCSTD